MAPGPDPVRRQRSEPIAVTGVGQPLGAALVARLRQHPARPAVIEIDSVGPGLEPALAGVRTVVHLAVDRTTDAAAEQRRATNIAGTTVLLDAVRSAGVGRVVVLTSAMVYGAAATNPVPLDEDAPLAATPSEGLVGDWLAVERLAASRAAVSESGLEVVSVRPASLVGPVTDPLLPGLFEAVRLLAIRDGRCLWQFCHLDDLLDALAAAATGAVSGAVTVGSDGWLERDEVERICGMRSVVLPAAAAFAAAQRLHRVGALSGPASDLSYLQHPWVVGSQRLRATGWSPRWTNQAALEEHLTRLGDRVGRSLVVVDRKYATRAAAGAGATLAVIGSFALARSRIRRR
ncbi:MAG TPA: NAD-dependent epimerase/dehydratase family protein [Mycobacteriales bacterium]|nr:NAD-dependent epimerase/dehydratase family protein [Mycobacteriales bacterium]